MAQRARDLKRATLSAADLALITASKRSDGAAVRRAVLDGANIHAQDPLYGYLTPLSVSHHCQPQSSHQPGSARPYTPAAPPLESPRPAGGNV